MGSWNSSYIDVSLVKCFLINFISCNCYRVEGAVKMSKSHRNQNRKKKKRQLIGERKSFSNDENQSKSPEAKHIKTDDTVDGDADEMMNDIKD